MCLSRGCYRINVAITGSALQNVLYFENFALPSGKIIDWKKNTWNSLMAVGLHTKEIMSMVLRISCTFSGAFCTVRIHVNSKDFKKVLECCSESVVRMRRCRDRNDYRYMNFWNLSFVWYKTYRMQTLKFVRKWISICYKLTNGSFWTLYDSILVLD